MRDLTGEAPDTIVAERSRVATEGWGAQLLASQSPAGNWGAGPRASQYLILGAKCHAVINGKYSPDIEDVQAIAKPVLRHRIVRSYHAEADGLSTDDIIQGLF